MKGENLLQHASKIVEDRRTEYGNATEMFEHVAKRWSVTLSLEVSPASVVLCLIDLKLTRLFHNPNHCDSIIDVAGYAAALAELTELPIAKRDRKDLA